MMTKLRLLSLTLIGVTFLYLATPLMAQLTKVHYPDPDTEMARMFYSRPYYRLQRAILDSARRHAIYSYIIANLSTPGFNFYEYLDDDDRRLLRQQIPAEQEFTQAVAHEFIMSRFNENSKRYTAYITLWQGKKNSLNNIVTLGK